MKQRFNRLSIRSKLSVIVLVTSGALIVLMATYFIVDKAISYRRNTAESITTLAKVIGINSMAAIAFEDPDSAKETLSALSAEPHVNAAAIFRADKTVFATYVNPGLVEDKPLEDSSFPDFVTTFINKVSDDPHFFYSSYDHMDISYPIVLNGKSIGHVAILADMSALNIRLIWFILLTGIAGIFLFIVVQVICAKLQRVITEPISDMLNTMQIVSFKRDYSQRVAWQAEDELGELINGFNDMLSKIQESDSELEKHRDGLEELVFKRTSELQHSNDQLKKEINDRIQMQEELSRAQKMEAIGILAAGVAHDLNNLLSGITSYPEYILANLDKQSPLFKPLKTIQNTGNKAAAIVEDLLVLSRRSIAMVDVLQVEDLVEDYLKSPELEKVMTYHPDIEIATRLADDLMPVAGSKIHLQKMLMNLIVNAIEAIPEGGQVNIEAGNRYVDTPIKGYETVKEGDYVRLSISDTGTGIEPKIIHRIFEPFFTRKQLGRSGSGLGMAIVWGTVKDHKGYIEVNSVVGKGTTFSIYLPVTRESAKVEQETSVDEYRGQGEFILVVDDSPDQREIASVILSDLGYTVEAVSSGEAALQFVKTRKPDLILLDMIMAPGIDGLETYRRMLKVCPDQRAVIASGYSESDQVKQTQALGAGQYVRKPYSMQKIAEAIKGELEKPRGRF